MKKIAILIVLFLSTTLAGCLSMDTSSDLPKIQSSIQLFLDNQLEHYFSASIEDDPYVVAGLHALKSVDYPLDLSFCEDFVVEELYDETKEYSVEHYLAGYHLGKLYNVEEPVSQAYFSRDHNFDIAQTSTIYNVIGVHHYQTFTQKEITAKIQSATTSVKDAGLAMMALSVFEPTEYDWINVILNKNKVNNGWYAASGDRLPSSYVTAHVAMGVTALGFNPNFYLLYDRTTRIINFILDYQQSDGTFKDTLNSDDNKTSASGACFAALCSYYVYLLTNARYCIL